MSHSDVPPPPPPRRKRPGWLTAIMAIFGLIMLLPGLCAVLIGGGSLIADGRVEQGAVPFVMLGLLIGVGGVLLVSAAIRGRRT